MTDLFGILFAFASIVSLLPSVAFIAWTEAKANRSKVLAIGFGAATGLLVPLIVLVLLGNPDPEGGASIWIELASTSVIGAVCGWIYWLMASRHAGLWREEKAGNQL